MSALSPPLRTKVTERACHRCEYCHLPTRGQVATFPIDHVVPKSAGGANDDRNLALCCPHCNAQKWKTAEAIDPSTKRTAPYFNPRSDVWEEHFRWSEAELGLLIGITSIGRATIVGLQINAPTMLELRELLNQLGLLPEINHDRKHLPAK